MTLHITTAGMETEKGPFIWMQEEKHLFRVKPSAFGESIFHDRKLIGSERSVWNDDG